MILNERDCRHDVVIQIAQQMITAARTAPKAKGVDIIEAKPCGFYFFLRGILISRYPTA